MRKNIAKVIEAFLRAGVDGDYHTKLSVRRFKGDSKGTCSTDGDKIFSYSEIIAERRKDGSVWIAPSESTRTTNSQIYALRWKLETFLACENPGHPDCLKCPELALACAAFTRKQLRLKQEGVIA